MSTSLVPPAVARHMAVPAAWPRATRVVAVRELRDQCRAAVGWGLGLGAFGAFIASIYPSVRSMLVQVVGGYPAGLKEAFGVGDMATVEGYVHTELFSLIGPLAVAVFAIRSVTRATVGAEERGELDTVLALPLSRSALVMGAFLATGAAAAVILALTGALTWIAGRIAGTGISGGLTAAGTLGLWPFTMFFASVAVLAGGVLGRRSLVTSLAGGALVAMYALDLAARLVDSLAPLRYVSAFHYYGAPLRDGLDLASSAVLVGAAVLLAAAGAVLFGRRDVGRR